MYIVILINQSSDLHVKQKKLRGNEEEGCYVSQNPSQMMWKALS